MPAGATSFPAQASITGRAVPFLLTRGQATDAERTARERSIVSVFREVGFDTYWFSTQQRDLSTGMINRFASEASAQRFFERRHDAVTVDEVKAVLSHSQALGSGKRFIVIHTLGSHFYFPSRYPSEFNVFPTEGPDTAGNRGVINAYDNTILYTDYFLASLIEVLQSSPGLKGLMYVSDHGENLYDDERQLFGHMLNTQYDLPIPMILWMSPELVARKTAQFERAKAAQHRPLSSRNVFYTLADLIDAKLGDGDPRQATMSVFSPELTDTSRIILAEPTPFDFDEKFPRRSRVSSSPGGRP